MQITKELKTWKPPCEKVDQNHQNIFYKENNFVYQSSNQNATDN